MSVPSPHTPLPGRADREREGPGFKNRRQCVSAMCPWAQPSAGRGSVYPSAKWTNDPFWGQSSSRAGRIERENGEMRKGEVPARCTQERGAMKCPRGKLGMGEGREEPSDHTHLQRQATCSPCRSRVSRVSRPPARSEVPRGHSTASRQGTRGSHVTQDRPSTTVHRWSPRRLQHRVQLEQERSESTFKNKTKQNMTD